MNLLTKLLVTLFAFAFVSCMTIRLPVATTIPDNNKTYQVDYLFEHEGCKVYRFLDMGNYVYFTNCQGDVTNILNDSTKTQIINKVRIQPVK